MALIDPELLALLACPAEDHGALRETGPREPGGDEGALECSECGLAFPIREGIPVLLLDEAYPAG